MNWGPLLFASISFMSGAFALGAVSIIYLQYRTVISRYLLLFILSLFLISTGFWLGEMLQSTPFNLMVQSTGSTLNVLILPYLACALTNYSLPQKGVIVIWSWNILFILGMISVYISPDLYRYMPILGGMLVATILFWLVFLTGQLKNLRDDKLKKSLRFFLIASALFVIFLVLDMSITTLPIEELSFLDNFSMPLFLGAINMGSFFFAGNFLNRGAYADEEGVTELFCHTFEISKRETDLINKILEGKSNKEIADELFISIKTVENHLYNIYRKTDVKGRGQLTHMLHSWEKE